MEDQLWPDNFHFIPEGMPNEMDDAKRLIQWAHPGRQTSTSHLFTADAHDTNNNAMAALSATLKWMAEPLRD